MNEEANDKPLPDELMDKAKAMTTEEVAALLAEHSDLYDEFCVLENEREDMKVYFREGVAAANKRASDQMKRVSGLVDELIQLKRKYNKIKARHKCVAKKSYFYGLNAGASK